MARLPALAKAGFYPIPPSHTEMIGSYVSGTEGSRIIDPCAGMGAALATLAQGWNMEPYACELHEGRATATREALAAVIGEEEAARRVIAGSFRLVVTPQKTFSVLYLNPPYHAGGEDGQLEYTFLKQTRPLLQAGGVLVWVIPQAVLTKNNIRRYVAGWFDDVRVVRFNEEEYAAYKQVVVFGTMKTKSGNPDEEALKALAAAGETPEEIDEIAMQKEPLYTAPSRSHRPFHFRSAVVKIEDALAEARTEGLMASHKLIEAIQPSKPPKARISPVAPLREGHRAGVVAAGFMNGTVLRQEHTGKVALVKGRSYKKVAYHTVIEEDGSGNARKITYMTEHPVTEVTYVDEKGHVRQVMPNQMVEWMNEWGSGILNRLTRMYPPRYSFDVLPWARRLREINPNRTRPGIGNTGLFPAQQHVVAAMAAHFQKYNLGVIVGDMGTGKTLMGPSVAHLSKARRSIVCCPTHLESKWAEEIEKTVPWASVHTITTITDVDRFFADEAECVIGVIRYSYLKMATGWYPTHDRAKLPESHRYTPEEIATLRDNDMPVTREQRMGGRYVEYVGVRCPECGNRLLDSEGIPRSHDYLDGKRRRIKCNAILTDRRWHPDTGELYARTVTCDAPLYQFSRTKKQASTGSFAHHVMREKRVREAIKTGQKPPEFDAPMTGNPRWPLARYIANHYPGQVAYAIFDEVHKTKGGDTDIGYAMYDLCRASEKVLALTGTITGGRSSNVFWLLYRTLSEVRDQFTDFEATGRSRIKESEWIERYGRIQEIRTATSKSGAQTGKTRESVRIREMPGTTPDMLSWIVNYCAFIALPNMGFALPEYREEVIEVEPGDELRERDRIIKQRFASIMSDFASAARYAGRKWTEQMLHPDAPWREIVVDDPRLRKEGRPPKVMFRVPGLDEDKLYPKEEVILDLITEEVAEGRGVFLFCQQTGAFRSIMGRWQSLLSEHGIDAAILPKGNAQGRRKWIDKQAASGTKVIIGHPRSVETGLDLLDYPTLVWMSTDTNPITVLQASRRAWRIGQEKDCRVVFVTYKGMMEQLALKVIMSSVYAAALVTGADVDDEGLASGAEDYGTSLQEQIREMMEEMEKSGEEAELGLSEMFAQANATVRDEKDTSNGLLDVMALPDDHPAIKPLPRVIELPTIPCLEENTLPPVEVVVEEVIVEVTEDAEKADMEKMLELAAEGVRAHQLQLSFF